MKIEVCFEVGDTIQVHEYPDDHGWSNARHGRLNISDAEDKFVADYDATRVICIRRKPETK